MHNLAKLYFQGLGVPQDENTGLMWLAKAAAHGHVIAEQQMAALMQRAKAEGLGVAQRKCACRARGHG